ncbi:hypothetical protein G9A89_009849 [Geosiphon pyriformis]|nr:hypothetical protein G9A89_009849 [Geosiphon pyriformis]
MNSWANSISRNQQISASYGSQPFHDMSGFSHPLNNEEVLEEPETRRYLSDIEGPEPYQGLNETSPLINSRRENPAENCHNVHPGKSTLAQTVFNAVNLLIGIAILSFPLAFKYCGWVIGSLIFIFCLVLTNYTAKTLTKCMELDPACKFYADIADLAFGRNIRIAVGIIFLLDLYTASVTFMILIGDSLKALYPAININVLKFMTFLVITPTTWMPLHLLSYTSLLGMISASSLVLVVIYDGFSKAEAPGSLWEPMHTTFMPSTWITIPLAFGLINAGLTGHSVLPSLFRDMEKPRQIKKAINISYIITSAVYLSLGISGYLMFGKDTLQEVTQNIMNTPGYNILVNSVIVWLIVVSPLSKFPLCLQPLNVALEVTVFRISFLHGLFNNRWGRFVGRLILRTGLSGLVVITSIIFPEFDRALSLLGSLFSFLISGIFPIAAHLKLFGCQLNKMELIWNIFLLSVSTAMAISGTIWTFFPNDWFIESFVPDS